MTYKAMYKYELASAAEAQTRITFAEQFGRQKHLEFIERTMKGQMELPFD